MDAALALKNLKNLNKAKEFLPILALSEQNKGDLARAEKLLDQAIIHLISDLENARSDHYNSIKKAIDAAIEEMKDLDNLPLKKLIKDSANFFQSHANENFIISGSQEDQKNLKMGLLLITAERFG